MELCTFCLFFTDLDSTLALARRHMNLKDQLKGEFKLLGKRHLVHFQATDDTNGCEYFPFEF